MESEIEQDLLVAVVMVETRRVANERFGSRLQDCREYHTVV